MFYAIVEKYNMEYVVATHDKVSNAIIDFNENYSQATHEIITIEE